MPRRSLLLASVLMLAPGVAALGQDWPREPPRGYMQAPPPDWDRRDGWRRMDERRRHEYWAERRRASWRCEHGDRAACRWLHANGPA